MARYNVDLQDNEGNAYQIMANPDSVAEFSPAVNRENIRSGETYRVIFGKIMKYLSEVGNAAYVGMANNCTTTIAGFALDARQGKELMDRINELNRDLGGLSFGQDADGNWGYKAGGADTVTPFKGDPDFDYEHGISIPYVVAAGNPNVLHYYTMTAEDAAYSYLALFAVTAGSVVSIELSGVSGPSIVCNKPGGSYSFALIANPVLNGKVNFRHGGTGDGHVYKLMIK